MCVCVCKGGRGGGGGGRSLLSDINKCAGQKQIGEGCLLQNLIFQYFIK